ncbi:L10-interacting MYB domain-containing protein-like [Abeliophyllum distichum]|uniref:L10-interacting MYB domain-containing protein-like n=1 Tax=Abeliophyllum distichum TaxID=126358 RepID=A0ABD1PSH7_9LAMI
MKAASPARKNVKWAEREYQIFVTTYETMIAEGHRRGKYFSKHGWERLVNLFNSSAAKNWSRTQFKNHWDSMSKIYNMYPLLFGKAFDSDKYAMTPTKLSQRRFDGVINCGSDSPHDTFPIFAEI